MPLVVCDVAFVPPFAIASRPEIVASERQVLFTDKHPLVMLSPLAKVEVAVPVCANVPTLKPPATVEVAVVDVALKDCNATVDVEIRPVPAPLTAINVEGEKDDAPVPPFPSPKTPVTCVVSDICPESVDSPMQLFATAKQPAAMVMPLVCVVVAVPPTFRFATETLPVKVDVPAPVTESDGVESVPLFAIEVVPVCPNAAVFASEEPANDVVLVAFVAVAFVVVSPPLNASAVVVAFPGNKYANNCEGST